MHRSRPILLLLSVAGVAAVLWGMGRSPVVHGAASVGEPDETARHAGSTSCRSCHESFYELWATSHHGLAMQPYTPELAGKNLRPQQESIRIREVDYLAQFGPEQGWVKETSSSGEKTYPIAHVMGGKNVYYFLTPLEQGRLQVLPVAYDVRRRQWFDTAASAVRHLPGLEGSEQLDWRDPLYTFNTSCHSCHVSQLSTNYDLATDTYNTVWSEPGINCETCHGPGEEHVKVCLEAPEGQVPGDLKIISTRSFTAEQTNSLCASCHAKQASLGASFQPGDRFFDHFDLTTLENEDYYPDGRDLGENYTYTSWLMSRCVKSGKLDCMHCHTSSGRYRFTQPWEANNACLPCHEEQVQRAAAHANHSPESGATRCVACHMPTTEFARMRRTDHSMRPPTPALSVALKSPNACNLCHTDRDAAWTDRHVRRWHQDDYQAPVLRLARLVDKARRGDWADLSEILAYLADGNHDEVVAATLTRLLAGCPADEKWPVLNKLVREDTSPLVRGSAAEALDQHFTRDTLDALLGATTDDYRVVRIRAASSLAGVPPDVLDLSRRQVLQRATSEFAAAMLARPDDYASYYNLGNFYMKRREYEDAISAFETSHKLRPDSILPLNNVALAYNVLGQNDKAEESLRKALALEPGNPAANLNLGMLLGELGRPDEAEKAFRAALQSDPNSPAAAYNLGVLLATSRPEEALAWCQKAYELRPEEGKYGYTYAFYLRRSGDTGKAVEVLSEMVRRAIPHADAYALLGAIHLEQGDKGKATEVYRAAQANRNLSDAQRAYFGDMLRRLQ